MDQVKPRVFIASSAESVAVARLISAHLDYDTIPSTWHRGTFDVGSNSIDALLDKTATVDFAIFVFRPDDVATMRNTSMHIVRDNVVFELGLFIGALGKDRCFMVVPRNTDLHLPSDLAGVTPADYDAEREDGDLQSALNYPVTQILGQIKKLGSLTRGRRGGGAPTIAKEVGERQLSAVDIEILALCAAHSMSGPSGVAYWSIQNAANLPDAAFNMSMLRLYKLGLIERKIETGEYGDFYGYLATESGMDFLSSDEADRIIQGAKPPVLDKDDIPF